MFIHVDAHAIFTYSNPVHNTYQQHVYVECSQIHEYHPQENTIIKINVTYNEALHNHQSVLTLFVHSSLVKLVIVKFFALGGTTMYG